MLDAPTVQLDYQGMEIMEKTCVLYLPIIIGKKVFNSSAPVVKDQKAVVDPSA